MSFLLSYLMLVGLAILATLGKEDNTRTFHSVESWQKKCCQMKIFFRFNGGHSLDLDDWGSPNSPPNRVAQSLLNLPGTLQARHFPLKAHIFLLNQDMLFLHGYELLSHNRGSASEKFHPPPEIQDKATRLFFSIFSTRKTAPLTASEPLFFQFFALGYEIGIAWATQGFHQGCALLR
jgi:hypothetical protein